LTGQQALDIKGSTTRVRSSLQVRFLARGFTVAGDHTGQMSTGNRWPFGPVALITPFNFPLEIPVLQLMGALYMGNKPLLHVDHRVCIVIEQFVRLLLDCGMPPGDMEVLLGPGTTMGHVLEHAQPRSTLFTGAQNAVGLLACSSPSRCTGLHGCLVLRHVQHACVLQHSNALATSWKVDRGSSCMMAMHSLCSASKVHVAQIACTGPLCAARPSRCTGQLQGRTAARLCGIRRPRCRTPRLCSPCAGSLRGAERLAVQTCGKANLEVTMGGMTLDAVCLRAGSSRVAERLAVQMRGKVYLEDAGFDWKILGPDVSDVDYVAWQCDQDAFACRRVLDFCLGLSVLSIMTLATLVEDKSACNDWELSWRHAEHSVCASASCFRPRCLRRVYMPTSAWTNHVPIHQIWGAIQAPQWSRACSGQKCSAQSIMFMHENWASSGLLDKCKEKADARKLDDLTVGPVLTVTTERMLAHVQKLSQIPGALLHVSRMLQAAGGRICVINHAGVRGNEPSF
jgi:Aldehyde dehydrogenase family